MSETPNPFEKFDKWLMEATESEINDPNAMSLATATPEGVPSVRMVLLKGVDERGFVFYTNLGSQKAQEIQANPNACLNFHWKSLRRQIRIMGALEQVSNEEADIYYQSRDRVSRIGAWASKQSQPLEGRFELEKRVAEYTAKFGIGEIPRPEFWSGFRVSPKSIEFWSDGKFRLHDRIFYKKEADGTWETTRLYP